MSMSAGEESDRAVQTTEIAAEALAPLIQPASAESDSIGTSRSHGWTSQMDDPPTGSRNLGGSCPRCDVQIESRLKTRYDDELTARFVLVGYCHNCAYYAEGAMGTVSMNEMQL